MMVKKRRKKGREEKRIERFIKLGTETTMGLRYERFAGWLACAACFGM